MLYRANRAKNTCLKKTPQLGEKHSNSGDNKRRKWIFSPSFKSCTHKQPQKSPQQAPCETGHGMLQPTPGITNCSPWMQIQSWFSLLPGNWLPIFPLYSFHGLALNPAQANAVYIQQPRLSPVHHTRVTLLPDCLLQSVSCQWNTAFWPSSAGGLHSETESPAGWMGKISILVCPLPN